MSKVSKRLQDEAEPILPNLTDDPVYAREAGKLAQLQAKLRETVTSHKAIFDQLASMPGRGISNFDAAVEQVLMGHDIEDAGEEVSARNKQLQRLEVQEQVLRRAIEGQELKVTNARSAAARPLLTPLLPHWRAMVRRQALALVELVAAMVEERQLLDELNQRDFPYSGMFQGFNVPLTRPNPNDRHSLFVERIAAALRLGVIELAEVDFMTRSPDVLAFWKGAAHEAQR